MKGLWFFIQFGWKSEKKYIVYNVLYQFVNALIPLVAVILPKFIIDELTGQMRLGMLFVYIAILIGYNLFAGILSNWLMQNVFTLRCKVAADFGLFMHKKLADADFERLEDPTFLDMKEKANKFIYGDWQGFSYVLDSALMIIGQFFTLAGIIAIVAALNVWMVLLFVALVLISTVVDAWAKKNEMKISLEQVRVERGWRYFGDLFEKIEYGKEIRINSLGDWLLAREEGYAKEAVAYYKRRNSFYIKSGVFGQIASAVQQILAYVYLINRVISKAISIGDFTMYVGAVAAFSGAMKRVMTSFVEVKAYGIYYEAMRDYMNIPSKLRDSGTLAAPNRIDLIEFRNVSFQYSGAEHYALRNINMKIAANEKLSIVGENGAGKTTFVKLLCRLYEPSEGEILLNGIPINSFDCESYMKLLSAVFQDFKLFSFSIKENVAFDSESSDEEVEKILNQVGLFSKLSELPNGMKSSVYKTFDANGFEPSGGEGQRIAIARAIMKNSPIIRLDEPTAALDPRAEYEIYRDFNKLTENKTAIYISHRLSSTKFCDKIAVFKRGKIVEYGAHNELYEKQGLYHELFDMQSQFYV